MTFHGREWLPIREAAKYLSEKLEDTWRKQHVYIAVLDRRLPLVARLFSGTKDLVGKEVEGLVNVPIKGGAKQYLEQLEHAVNEPFPDLNYVEIDWIAGAVVERDGEEHCLGLVPGAHSGQVHVAAAGDCAQVVAVIDGACQAVGVGVDDDG